jgi:hypothetical protein
MEELSHFVTLARRGEHPGASGGEGRAARLAAAVLEDLPGLDTNAIDGFLEFIRLLRGSYTEARRLLQ